ncbi:MAG: ATP-binding protein, partial [Polyangiales bacterium]
ALLEEAAIDGIPVIAIDPKGDLGNLLLSFPNLAGADFAPWVDPAEAERRGISREALATETAERMRRGLDESAQDAARIGRLAQAADFAIYTPGSSAGLPLSIVRSLEAPPPALRADDERLRERVEATVSGLLGLLGIDADPLQSRDHILLSRILVQAFSRGESLSLTGVLQQVKTPPFQTLGALDLESFYPEKERMKLVLALNNLLASPAFESWLSGEPLDVQRLLYTEAGKPRVSILSIGHLSDAQRMFFVTLLLNEVLAYTRAQSGTSSLRAIVYMDEVFGYFPPVAEPPSKRPLLTLLKQARAFGVGVVLATQNPADLDYKGLSNIGTWFLGRLQTERDRARVLDGMEGAASTSGASFDRSSLDGILAGLAPRSFVLHSARGGAPRTFSSRQTLSFLRGPLTRSEIKTLMEPRKAARPSEAKPPPAAAPVSRNAATTAAVPVLPADVEAVYLPPRGGAAATAYAPALLAVLRVTAGEAPPRTLALLAPLRDGPLAVDFAHAEVLSVPLEQLGKQPEPGLAFAPLPTVASDKKRYAAWGKEAVAIGCARAALTRWKSPSTKLESEPGESEGDFRVRVLHAAREKRDAKVAALATKYEARLATAREREAKAAAQHAREYEQASAAKLTGAVDFGSAVLSTLFGTKRGFGRADASKAARTASKLSKEQGDVDRSAQKLAEATDQRAELEEELARVVAEVDALPVDEPLESKVTKVKKSEVQLSFLGIAFVPG